jgi:hypothetical protein
MADFGAGCAVVQDQVELSMSIEVPVRDPSGNSLLQSLYVSNVPQTTPPAPPVITPQCFHIINSCLARGTRIEMADGRSAPIETIRSGDQVYSPFDLDDHSLAVMDTTKGVELVPMVHIEDEHGRSLLLTEAHPVVVEGRGMVMAKRLRAGDQVTTKDGPSRLVRVTRESYSGTVHNLKVGDGPELARLARDQTAVYANGFLVGDSQIQEKNELAEVAASRRPSGPVRLSTRWRKDYESLRNAKR